MTNNERRHLSRLALIGCMACRKMGYMDSPAEIHHIRAGVGKGQRASHYDAIPLCASHHRGIRHPEVPSIHLDKRAFIEQFGTEQELLAEIKVLLK